MNKNRLTQIKVGSTDDGNGVGSGYEDAEKPIFTFDPDESGFIESGNILLLSSGVGVVDDGVTVLTELP